MKKALMTMLVGLMIVPAVALADEQYANVTDISNDDSADVTTSEITGEKTSETIVIYSDVSVNPVEGTEDGTGAEKRPDGYAWLGIKVDAPSDTPNAKWSREANINLPEELQRSNVDVKEDDPNYYFPISVDLLKSAIATGHEYLEYTYTFNWKDDVTQKIIIKIVPKGVKMYEDKDTRDNPEDQEALWDEEIMDAYVAELTATNSKQDDVPKTGDTMPITVIGAILFAISIGAYSLKLAFSRK